MLRKGTIVDSTRIEAPSSTKNREKQRDPDAHQVKTGLTHHLEVTSANVHDVTVVPKLLTGEETGVYGDSGYLGAEKREDAITHNVQGKGRACFRSRQGAVSLPKNAISGTAKADSQNKYAFRACESLSC